MSEIARWDLWDGQMSHSVSGLWVRYAAHEFEVERLAAELAEAQDRCRALTLAVEQADEMKAHAEASAAAEEAETDRVTAELHAAQAEVERLKDKIATTPTFINFPWDTYERLKNANEHLKEDVATLTAQRDAARAEVERLRKEVERLTEESEGRRVANHRIMTERGAALNEVERLRAEVERLKASGQGMLDSSRATDEDIWREAFMRQLFDHDIEKLMGAADLALALYRKRWPR